MPKIIVTHINPDSDALTSIWLFKRFHPDFKAAQVKFVPAGETWQNQPVDSDPNIVHVDTGRGKFDHHQLSDDQVCAASRVLKTVKTKLSSQTKITTLGRLVKVVCQVDHFAECYWPETEADRYGFTMEEIVRGWKLANQVDNYQLVELGLKVLDGIFQTLLFKVKAEVELKQGQVFKLATETGIGLITQNDEVIRLGQKKGHILVVRKDPKSGRIRIKAQPKSGIDLTQVWQELKQQDPKATWFLHASKKMLLNGSGKNPTTTPSWLSLKTVIEIIKAKIKINKNNK